MSRAHTPSELDWDEARQALGVSAEATDAELRAAYVEQVRLHPPDRDAEGFERIRDAYARLRDPRVRAQRVLASPLPNGPMTELLEGVGKTPRRFVGPGPWFDVLREKRT
jgi:hypothetical protein